MTAPLAHPILPADKQREKDEALVAFWNDGSAALLFAQQNWSVGAYGKRAMPDTLEWITEYTSPFWRATTIVEGHLIQFDATPAKDALDGMLIRGNQVIGDLAQERYEDNMAGVR